MAGDVWKVVKTHGIVRINQKNNDFDMKPCINVMRTIDTQLALF